jgi:hypothetical protein
MYSKNNTNIDNKWMENDDVLCREVSVTNKKEKDVFFPKKNTTYGVSICNKCRCKRKCLEYGISSFNLAKYGILGGATPNERQRIRNKHIRDKIPIRNLIVSFINKKDEVCVVCGRKASIYGVKDARRGDGRYLTKQMCRRCYQKKYRKSKKNDAKQE